MNRMEEVSLEHVGDENMYSHSEYLLMQHACTAIPD